MASLRHERDEPALQARQKDAKATLTTPDPLASPMTTADAKRALRRLRRGKASLDFSDYLELRRLRDLGARDADLDAALAELERALPVPFADAIPHLATLAEPASPPPRGLSAEARRVMFAMREEFAGHGGTRAALMGFDLPDGEGLKDWLDFIENERKHALAVRSLLRELDRKIWAVYTGDRRMPTAPLPPVQPLARR